MTAVPPPTTDPAQDPAQQQAQPPAPTGGGLPPTGLQQQLSTIKAQPQPQVDPTQTPSDPAIEGSTSLQQLGDQLAKSYGLDVGRNSLFDDQGNALQTPEQMAQASGGKENMATAAAKMNLVADALARRQTEQSQDKAQAALATGIGLVQQRARGSLATLQSGLYSQMSNLYANQEYEAADFTYWIQREEQLYQRKQAHRARKAGRKGARVASIFGAIGLAAAPFTGGASLGVAAQGLGQLGNTGWL